MRAACEQINEQYQAISSVICVKPSSMQEAVKPTHLIDELGHGLLTCRVQIYTHRNVLLLLPAF
jgi:hypothetical protein